MLRILSITLVLVPLAAGEALADDSEPQCITNYGKTACGYHCKANYGKVACAETPGGLCISNYGEVTCWDPPVAVLRNYEEPPAPRCISNYGKLACGYDCKANYGQVACAQTPAGTCISNYGKVLCWDPPRRVLRRYGDRTPGARCISNYNKLACGYGCKSGYGEVACAKTPKGFCKATNGRIVCWDPKPRRARRHR